MYRPGARRALVQGGTRIRYQAVERDDQALEDTGTDRPVPGEDYSFGEFIRAQALGDYEALVARGRPVLRVTDPEGFLEHV